MDCILKYAITNGLIKKKKKIIVALIRPDMIVYALRPVGQLMNGLISSCQEAKSPLTVHFSWEKKHQFYVKMIEDQKQSVLGCEFPPFDKLAGG